MFEEMVPAKKLTEEEIEAYLERIGYSGSRKPEKAVLDELIWKHQTTVPFETLDCHDFKVGASMDPDVVFDKVIRQKRGGHCLELNGTFFRLLISLGFDARPCLCRVLLGSDEFTHPFDHRTALVLLDGHVYYVDIGLGGPMPPAALDIEQEGWQEMRGDAYAVRPSDAPGWFDLCRKTPHGNHNAGTPEAMRIEARFATITCYETDFVFLNQYMSFHPDALHVAHRILNLRTEKGYYVIEDDIFQEISDGEIVEEYPVTGRLGEILLEKFGIDVREKLS